MIWIAAYLYVAGMVPAAMLPGLATVYPSKAKVFASVIVWPVFFTALGVVCLAEALRDEFRAWREG